MNDLKELEKANPIIQIATELGIKVRGSIADCFNIDGHTPDDKPSLFFNPAKNSFVCKKCKEIRGSAIDLVRLYNGWEREKAIEWLEHRVEFDLLTKKLYGGKGRKKG